MRCNLLLQAINQFTIYNVGDISFSLVTCITCTCRRLGTWTPHTIFPELKVVLLRIPKLRRSHWRLISPDTNTGLFVATNFYSFAKYFPGMAHPQGEIIKQKALHLPLDLPGASSRREFPRERTRSLLLFLTFKLTILERGYMRYLTCIMLVYPCIG